MMLLSGLRNGFCQVQKDKMAKGLQCLKVPDDVHLSQYNVNKAKVMVSMCLRGHNRPWLNHSAEKRYAVDNSHKQCPRTSLNLILIIATTLKLLSRICVGLSKFRRSKINISDHCLTSRFAHVSSYFLERNQHSGCYKLLAVVSFTTLALVGSRVITTRIQRAGRDQGPPGRYVFHKPQAFRTQDQEYGHTIPFLRVIILGLAYIALTALLALHLRKSSAYPRELDFYADEARYKQAYFHGLQKQNGSIIAGILITQLSSTQIKFDSGIASRVLNLFRIGHKLAMDQPDRMLLGVYKPMRQQLTRTKETKDSNSDVLENSSNLIHSAKTACTGISSPLRNSSVPWTSGLPRQPSGLNQLRLRGRRSYNTLSDLTHGGPDASPVAQSNNRFGNKNIPMLSSASCANLTEDTSSKSNRSTGREGMGNLRRVRDLDMEAKARAMGFSIGNNRFNLPEETISHFPASGATNNLGLSGGDSVHLNDEGSVLQLSGAPSGLGIAGGDIPLAKDKLPDSPAAGIDNTLAQSEDGTPVMKDDEALTQPIEADIFLTKNGDSPQLATKVPSDPLAWLRDSFRPVDASLLTNFGTPPKDNTYSPNKTPCHSWLSPSGGHLHDISTTPPKGEFSTSDVSLGHHSCADNSNSEQAYMSQIQRLEGEVKMLTEQLRTLQETTEIEVENARAGEAAALERVKMLEMRLRLLEGGAQDPVDERKKYSLSTINTCGSDKKPTETGFALASRDTDPSSPSERALLSKKSKTQESGLFSRFFGTKEPSREALNKLSKKTFADASVNRDDPNAATKLKVSSKKLPPEAPKPASKDPIPKDYHKRQGRFGSVDNLRRKDTQDLSSEKSMKGSRTNVPLLSSIVEVPNESPRSLESRSQDTSARQGDQSHVDNTHMAFSEVPAASPRAQMNQHPTNRSSYDPPSLSGADRGTSMEMVESSKTTRPMTPERKPHHPFSPRSGLKVPGHKRSYAIDSGKELLASGLQQKREAPLLRGMDSTGWTSNPGDEGLRADRFDDELSNRAKEKSAFKGEKDEEGDK